MFFREVWGKWVGFISGFGCYSGGIVCFFIFLDVIIFIIIKGLDVVIVVGFK